MTLLIAFAFTIFFTCLVLGICPTSAGIVNLCHSSGIHLRHIDHGSCQVESLATNVILPVEGGGDTYAGAPLLWVQQREVAELAVLHGRSSHSSWCVPLKKPVPTRLFR